MISISTKVLGLNLISMYSLKGHSRHEVFLNSNWFHLAKEQFKVLARDIFLEQLSFLLLLNLYMRELSCLAILVLNYN